MASEEPREKLRELMEKNGDSLLQDRDRCEGLLKDYCGVHRREIAALVGALEERVPLELRSQWQSAMSPEAMRARLVQRLEENRGLAPEIANYAVDTWAYALGVGLGRSSDRVQDGSVVGAANDLLGGASAADRRAGPLPAAATAGLSNQNKAIVGGVGLLAVAAVAFALLHPAQSPAPAPPIVNPPAQGDPHGLVPTPAPAAVQDGHDDGHGKAQAEDGKPGSGRGRSQQAKSSPAIAAATSVVVRLDSDFNSDKATVGEMLPATVVTPLTSGGNVVVPRGAPAQLRVVRIDNSGKISGKSEVEFALAGLTVHGKLMHISGSSKPVDGPSQGARTAERTGIGGAAGAAIGALTGHLFHRAGTGATAGAGAGGATGALTSHPAPVKVSAETVLQFRLRRGIAVGSGNSVP